jgi:pterin-4a-carbinolamine dehydratase
MFKHHPDYFVLVKYRTVTIRIWTHAAGGVTEQDLLLAKEIAKIQHEFPKPKLPEGHPIC